MAIQLKEGYEKEEEAAQTTRLLKAYCGCYRPALLVIPTVDCVAYRLVDLLQPIKQRLYGATLIRHADNKTKCNVATSMG